MLIIVFARILSLSHSNSSRNSDPGSHSSLPSPLPTTVRALFFYLEMNSIIFSLLDSRRKPLVELKKYVGFGLYLKGNVWVWGGTAVD